MSRCAGIDCESLLHDLRDCILREWAQPQLESSTDRSQRLLGAAEHRIDLALSVIIRHENRDRMCRDLSSYEVKKLERRCVSPLKVLENDAQRLLRRELAEQLREIPLQPCLALRCIFSRRCSCAIARCAERREKNR